MNESRVLVVAAHPDDEVLGCGGTMARLALRGEVRILILGEGITSRQGLTEEEINADLQRLNEAVGAAANMLGVASVKHRLFPDQRFDTVPILALIHEIELTMRGFEPTLVLTHHAGDVNLDHRLTREAVEAAVRPMARSSVEAVLGFEVPSSSDWNFTRPRFAPNVFYSLLDQHILAKVEAMKCYAGEVRPFPHPRSEEYLRALARVRGGQCGREWAEGFELVYERRL